MTSPTYGPNGRDAVFVLDDREEITQLTSGYFEAAGIPAFVATDVDNAWDALEKQHRRLKLALIDKNLHQDREGGLNFLEEARRRYPDVIFVLVTGWSLLPAERGRIEGGQINWLDKGALSPTDLLTIFAEARQLNLRGILPASEALESVNLESRSQSMILASEFREETIKALREENKGLRAAVREMAGDLIKRLRGDKFSKEESAIFLDGRELSIEDLVEEIETCSPLGIRLLKLHSSIFDDLIAGKHRSKVTRG